MKNIHKTFILMLCFALLAIPIHADTTYIDAQKYTTCDSGNCKTVVPLDQFMNQGLITALKAIDHTPAKPVLTDKLLGFNYSFSGNNMIFEGRVVDSVYWTFNLGNSFIIDPWWNYSAYVWNPHTWASGATSCGGSAGATNLFGINITTTTNQTCINWVKLYDAHATASWVAITNLAGTAIENSTTSSGNNWTFGCVELNASTIYHIITSTVTTRVSCTGSLAYPYSNNGFTVPSTIYCASGNPASCTPLTNEYFAIESVGYAINESVDFTIWWVPHLWLNGNESNVSIITTQELNASATSNLTGSGVAIYIDDILSAENGEGDDYAENVSNYTPGLYNITAFFGNATTNATLTYWLNVSLPVTTGGSVVWDIANLEPNIVYCSDNNTLYQNYLEANTTRYITCNNGCDNVSMVCSPTQAEQNFYGFLIVIGFFIALAVILKYMRRF